MSEKEIQTGGGASVGGDVASKQFTGRDDQRSSQNVTFSNPDNMMLWAKLLEIGGTVNHLVIQMDNLPHRVDRLERLEVVVRPGPEVILRPATHDSVTLSAKTLIFIFLVALLAVLALVAWLVYLQIS